MLTLVFLEGGGELPMLPQHSRTADESVCVVGYEGSVVKCSTEMERKNSPCWKQSGMGEHGSCWLKTYLCYFSTTLATTGKTVILKGFIVTQNYGDRNGLL